MVATPGRFDLREARRTLGIGHSSARGSDVREGVGASGSGDGWGFRREGVAGIAVRLAAMFPSFSEDTLQAVLSQLFRADASVSREQLADKAVAKLVEMSFADGDPHSVISFEPRHTGDMNAAVAPLPATPGTRAEQALHGLNEIGAPPDVGCDPGSGDEDDDSSAFAMALDAELAQLLTLPDEELGPAVRTLVSILDRIHEEPSNKKVRRIRMANRKFATAVGRHAAAVALLRLAGFVDENGEGGDDAVLANFEDPATSEGFAHVRDSLRGVVDACAGIMPPADRSRPKSAPPAAQAAPLIRASMPPNQRRRREWLAELTERRLRDPRSFRAEAERRGATNRHVGGRIPRPAAAATASARGGAEPQRRAQHFTLADIDRMRVTDEISSMPSYAEEYRRSAHATPVHDYSSLVARGYDPELIARQALDGTNRYRAFLGVAPLRWHDGIARIAAQHAAQMASGAMPFSHDGFDARVRAFPVAYQSAAENLALNQGVADVAGAAVDGWIKSPGHEKNLRGPFNLCGIGVARAASGTFYLTQLFANAR